ncbi:MAG TPA: GNAT family protein [Candidatus Limiplasma sp.]|nr:GNAT family protein [Candidatus Limiplasma sp.]
MAKDLFAKFPHIESDDLILRKIEPEDLDGLCAIYLNETIFRYIPGKVYKTRAAVSNMIGHFERDFGKRKTIFLGICLAAAPEYIVGVAELFDYDKAVNMVTLGYRLNEDYWSQGIAAMTVRLLTDYLFNEIGINRIQAFVMPENVKSHAVLMRNGFHKEGTIRQGALWTGKGIVDLTEYSLLRNDKNA